MASHKLMPAVTLFTITLLTVIYANGKVYAASDVLDCLSSAALKEKTQEEQNEIFRQCIFRHKAKVSKVLLLKLVLHTGREY